MVKQGLIISIDYTDTYCQVCYYSMRHNRPESVTTGSEVMRYIIPTALTYDMEQRTWLIGNDALENAQLTKAEIYTDFPEKCLAETEVTIGEKSLGYKELFAIFLGKMVEMAKAATAVRNIYNVTVNVKSIDNEIRKVFTDTLELIGIEASQIRFLCCGESFAYYVLGEDERLWKTGALLFDFSEDGFYIRLLKIAEVRGNSLIFVEETDCNEDFSMSDLGSEILRKQLDDKLLEIFEDIYSGAPVSGVFFSGSGFNELWFEKTLARISETARAFKGNNIYVKGACLAGFRSMSEQKDYPIVCRERTKVRIYTDVKYGNESKQVVLADACTGWHEAGSRMDLIPDNAQWLTLKITSILTGKTETFEFDLEEFPERPNKATRIELAVRYLNEKECRITVSDKGFGEFFESSGKKLVKTINVDSFTAV